MSIYLIIVSAPSGAGKTTLAQKLLEDFPSLKPSISSTTRPTRKTEEHGKDYFFLSEVEFKQQMDKFGFAEWAKVHGHYYGTSRAFLEEAIKTKSPLLLVIDIQGARQLRALYGKACLSIFVSPPSFEELEARLRARGTDPEPVIQKRLANAKSEMAESSKFDVVIVNDSLERAYQELKSVVQAKTGLRPKD